MAELVRHGVNGLLFRLGDAANLRSRLQEVIDQPALVDKLRGGIPEIPEISRQAQVVRGYYEGMLS
jgi:hypothetical protein